MNYSLCIVGVTLFLASIYMHFLKDDNNFTKFTNLLNSEQLEKYNLIIHERLRIYMIGVFIGLVLGLVYLQFYGDNICIFLSLVFFTKLFVYHIYPKSTYMLYHLTNSEQVDAWTDIYVHMKTNWVKSIGLGLISYIFIYFGFIKK